MAQTASAGSPVAVKTLVDVPETFGQLSRLVLAAGHVNPRTAGRLAADHSRTMAILAGLLERRDRAPDATAPALLGAAAKLPAQATEQVVIRVKPAGGVQMGVTMIRRPRRQMNRAVWLPATQRSARQSGPAPRIDPPGRVITR